MMLLMGNTGKVYRLLEAEYFTALIFEAYWLKLINTPMGN